jgi:hypothetical protein
MLKRWRDEQQEVRKAIKSIVLQVLIASHMPDIPDDDERISETLANLHAALDPLATAPPVWNPVLPDEDLAARWDDTAFRNFKRELSEAVELSQKALSTNDIVEAAETWREVFGEAFPLPTRDLFGVRLADTSHSEPFQSRGWYQALDARSRVPIMATEQRGKRGRASAYPNDGPLLFAGKKLKFKANYASASPVDLWWRVTNTGEHARSAAGLRGQFFKAKQLNGSPSPDPTENWEDTAYTGSHLVEVFLVSGGRVVARSEPFKVNIYKKGRRWAW